MTIKKAYHVVVIGGGVTGLSSALHLKRSGISHLAVAQAETLGTPSRLASGFCSGGQLDNFTRLTHSHGIDLATSLWKFGDHAFDSFLTFARENRVPWTASRRYRFLASPSEVEEAQSATAQLASCQLAGSVLPASPKDLAHRILGVQDDGPRGAFVDPDATWEALMRCTSGIPRLPRVASLRIEKDHVALRLEDARDVKAEVVVLSSHLGTRHLVPELASSLVPFADQWTDFSLPSGSLPDWCVPGLVFSTNHTHEWGVIVSQDRLRFGGGRYLRPLAGIEADHASVDPKIIKHLKWQLGQTFARVNPETPIARSTFGLLDIRPCDELPVIGPMFGEPRILLATGFSGQGLPIGFYTGSLLAELIAQGASPKLPRAFWPERLRSLPQT